MTDRDLEFLATNVDIMAHLIERALSGKTSTDLLLWDRALMADPAVRFSVATMEDNAAMGDVG